MRNKSTPEQIRQRFDRDADRFSNLETGQSATIDAPLVLQLIAKAASAVKPAATHLLDIGCGAGNHSLKLLQDLRLEQITLVDLSLPMLMPEAGRIFLDCRSSASFDSRSPKYDVGALLDLLQQVGFSQVEILHKNSCFAAFGAIK